MSPAPSPAEELLLLGLAPYLNTEYRILNTELDWPHFLALAEFHRVQPLLYNRLKDAGLPDDVRATLELAAKANLLGNLMLSAELVKLADAFAGAVIPFMPFKGPALAREIYGSLAWRECYDLDLLIRRRDLTAATAVFEELGYLAAERPPPGREALWLASRYELSFSNPRNGGVVELHWAVAPPFFPCNLAVDELLEQAVPMKFENRQLRRLPAPLLLLLLCVHDTRHRWFQLCWVADIAAVLYHNQALDWSGLIQLAEHHRCRRLLALALSLAGEIPGGKLPPQAREFTDSEPVHKLAADIREGWFEMRPEPAPRALYRFYARCRERPGDRLTMYRRLLFQPTIADLEWVRLPAGLAWLYPLLRPLRLLARTLRGGSV